MAAKTSWHIYGTKSRHCHPICIRTRVGGSFTVGARELRRTSALVPLAGRVLGARSAVEARRTATVSVRPELLHAATAVCMQPTTSTSYCGGGGGGSVCFFPCVTPYTVQIAGLFSLSKLVYLQHIHV